MGFKGYRYRYTLHAEHSIVNPDTGVWQAVHSHSFIIYLYLEKLNNSFLLFDEIEKEIDAYLDKYEDKLLNETEKFINRVPTVEEIGRVFYDDIRILVENSHMKLNKLEISETPIRVFVVNDGLTSDITISDKREAAIQDKLRIAAAVKPAVSFEEHAAEYMDAISSITEVTVGTADRTHEEKGTAAGALEEAAAADDLYSDRTDKPITKKSFAKHHSNTNAVHTTKTAVSASSSGTNRILIIKVITALLFIAGVSVITMTVLYNQDNYPFGVDVYGHLYRGDLLFQNIKEGNWYPLFSPYWYNGLQPFRYWGPVPYYIFSVLEFFTNGDIMKAYLLFIGTTLFLGACGWLLLGIRTKRIALSTILGCLWFFFPDNFRVFFYEGNLSRVGVAIFLPFLFFFIWEFVNYKKKYSLYFIVLNMILITLSHTMIAAMVGVTSFLFTVVYSIINKRFRESIEVIISLLIGLLISGIWLYPALTGGLISFESSANEEVLEMLSYPLSVSINPLYRLSHGSDMYYFGLSVFIICIIGCIYAKKKSFAGYIIPILILIGTTKVAAPFIAKLPLGSLLWAMRFTPIVYAVFILSTIEWKQVRKWVLVLMCVVMIIDFIPTLNLEQYDDLRKMAVTYDEENDFISSYSLDTVKANAGQRVSAFDLSSYSSFLPYYFCIKEPKAYYTFGWSWQGANTASNIVMLNSALEQERFYYLFDRSLEMGDNTLLFSKEVLGDYELKKLTDIADRFGYKLIEDGENSIVFSLNYEGSFGIHTEYKGIAIGSSASEITLQYPYFYHADSTYLDDYTLDELSQYKKIFLSGFQYHEKAAAEKMIKSLSTLGIEIYIDMNRIAVDAITNRGTFLGVSVQPIVFRNKFPDLIFKNEIIRPIEFDSEYKEWSSCYLTGLKNVEGYSWFNNRNLAFYGTNDDRNIVFMGYNLLFHGMTSDDEAVLSLMNDILGITETDIPYREIVPIDLEIGEGQLTITTPKDNTDTGIAYQDNFSSTSELINKQNMLYVNRGTTVILFKYPYLRRGLAVSGLGIAGLIILSFIVFKRKKGVHEETL